MTDDSPLHNAPGARQGILVVGSLNMDQIVRVEHLPVIGETVLGGGELKLVPGGKGANQAVAMARLGARVRMAGCVGRDATGERLCQALQEAGVDSGLVSVDEREASGVAFILLVPGGANAIVVASGANMCVGRDPQQMQRILEVLPTIQALVLQLEIPVETVQALIVAGRRAGALVVLNLAPAQALPLEILRQVDVLILNETEASFLRGAFNREGAENAAELKNAAEAAELAHTLQMDGIGSVIITLGARGAVLVADGRQLSSEPPPVKVIDTTAAGDCFAGAFTVALTEGQTMEQALRFAVYASALKVTKPGAQSGLPTRAEVEAALRRV